MRLKKRTNRTIARVVIGTASITVLFILACEQASYQSSLAQGSEETRVKLIDASTEKPVAGAGVVIESVEVVVCRRAPCPPLRRVIWTGRSDAAGNLLLPKAVTQPPSHPRYEETVMTVDGYERQRLRLESGVIKLAGGDGASGQQDKNADLKLKVIDRATKKPIRNTAIEIYSDNGIRCRMAPCPTNGIILWGGKTDARGIVNIPGRVRQSFMTISATGYSDKDLLRESKKSAGGVWIIALQADPK